MAEASVANQTCQHCGADVRLNSQFCYKCGGEVAASETRLISDARKEAEATSLSPKSAESKNGNSAQRANEGEEPTDKAIPKPTGEADEPTLQSAASMRRKSKNASSKRVEVFWEEHENAPNVWFIVVAIFLTLFAAGVFYLAMYLK